MDDPSRKRPARRPTTRHVQYAAVALTYLVAGLHLFHPDLGFPRLVLLLSVDPALLLSDPRPVAFVLSGLALVVGVPAVAFGAPKRPVYALGVLLVVTYLVGYFAWHFSGHGGFLPGREPLYHGLSPLENVLAHLSGSPLAAAAVVSESLLAVLLATLYRRES